MENWKVSYRFDRRIMSEFVRLTYSDRDIIKEYTHKCHTLNCEYAPANVFWWNDNLDYAFVEGILVYRGFYDDNAVYSPMEFPEDVEGFVESLEKDAMSLSRRMVLNNLSEDMVNRMKEVYGASFEYGFLREDSDYIYKVSELINLSGTKFHSKKNLYNKFVKSYDYSYEEIGPHNIEECRSMKDSWVKSRDNEAESDILDKVFDNYDMFDFKGALLRVNGKVEAFTIGEELNSEVFVTHFEKANHEISGIYQAINRMFAENTIFGYIYVNREDDMGIEGLRKAKLSYNPVILLDKYYAYRTN